MDAKRAFVLVLAVLVAVMTGCTGGGKYSDLVEVNTRFVSAMEDYVTATGEAVSAEDVAKAINAFAEKVEKLAPKIRKVQDKYPEMDTSGEIPEELKAVQKKAEGLQQQMMASYMNMMKYMEDPEVKKAHQRLSNAMVSMK